MEKILIIIFGLLFSISSFGQTSKVIKTDHSKKEAVIFTEDYKKILVVSDDVKHFTPDQSQIEKIEIALCDSINNFNRKYRQYAGFIDKNNDSIVIINIITSKVVRKNKSIWYKDFVFGFGDFWEKNQHIAYYNLSKGALFNPSGDF